MKTFIGLIMTIVIFASCSTDNDPVIPQVEEIDFSGVYILEVKPGDCLEENTDLENELVQLVINKVEDTMDEYFVDFSDEVIFSARANDRTLILDRQTLNEDEEFDVITMEGVFTYVDEKSLDFKFYFNVDEEGSSNCELTIHKE